ncbi:hypothetical protein C9374_002665 [Naegleria lovaniensis]|uniref:Uncharacterized protein n=1 Tax=Naegleria lovaniensis TaxID=51637 RepID=A0AA88GU65_NAELO|nr:uncharacterized protein C9374_002665 [Naegleria lovaniensis]KAG2386219.1 hypothetical protein C9374_002665 [Naegleria lovaniensis]
MKRLTPHSHESRSEKRRKNTTTIPTEYDLFKEESLNSLIARSKRDWEASEIIKRNGYKLIFTDIAFHKLRASSYKIWDLKNYELKFEMSGKDVFEVRLSPGNILVILREKNGVQPIKLIDYASGQVIKSLYLKTQNRGKVLFLELFLDRLFFFQERRDLTIIEPFKEKVLSVVNNFKKPYSFIYMYKHCKYIGFRGNKIAVWNLQGTVDVEFEDNILADGEGKYCTFYLSEEQDVIISSCLVNPMDKDHCTINISEIKTGKLLKKIECQLSDITALMFCENRQELFVGHGNGQITVYSVLANK